MKTVKLSAAKAQLSRLVELAVAGEDVVISKGDVPLVRLVPVRAPPSGRRFGAFPLPDGVPASFFEPLPDEELDAWERA